MSSSVGAQALFDWEHLDHVQGGVGAILMHVSRQLAKATDDHDRSTYRSLMRNALSALPCAERSGVIDRLVELAATTDYPAYLGLIREASRDQVRASAEIWNRSQGAVDSKLIGVTG